MVFIGNMIAKKLFTLRKDGTLSSLFYDKKRKLTVGVMYSARNCAPPGRIPRPGFRAVKRKNTFHFVTNGRVWCEVWLENVTEDTNYRSSTCFIAQRMCINKIL